MGESVLQKKKGFVFWMLIGFIIFCAFVGGFTILAKQYISNVNLETVAKRSDQLDFSDGILTGMNSNIPIYFELDKDTFVNYIIISVKEMSIPAVNTKLYYADNENDLNKGKVIDFYLREGSNEIRTSIGEKRNFRLDI